MTTDPRKQTPAQRDRDFLAGSGAVDWYDLPEDEPPACNVCSHPRDDHDAPKGAAPAVGLCRTCAAETGDCDFSRHTYAPAF